MADTSPVEEARNPGTSARRLADLAARWPETQVLIAQHPNAYDDLLEWLHTYGAPEVKAAVEQRQGQSTALDDSTRILAGVGASDLAPSTAEPVEPVMASPPRETPIVAVPWASQSQTVSEKKYMTAVFLMLFFGGYGADRFYLGRIGTGVLKLLTLGFFGLWTMIDGIRIANGTLRATDELELDGFRQHHRPVQILVWILAGIYFLAIALAVGFVIWAFAQASASSNGASTYSSSSYSDDSATSDSSALDDQTDTEPDDGYYSDDPGYGDGGDYSDDGPGSAIDSEEEAPDTNVGEDNGSIDPLLADAAVYCPSGYAPQAYGETESAFFVICSDGYDLAYYGESYRLGTGITLPAYETNSGYEATNYEDGVTTVYSVSEYSLTITNQDTGNVALDETVTNWAEDETAGS